MYIISVFTRTPVKYLPFCCRVNKQYESVLEASAVVYNGSSDLEWVQLYKGLARGLGGLNTDIALCAKDGNTTLETFRAALTAFEDREIFTGVCVNCASC